MKLVGVRQAKWGLVIILFVASSFFLALNLSGAGCAWLDKQSFGISFYTHTGEHGCEIQWSQGTRYSIDGKTHSQLWQRPFIHWINSPRQKQNH